MVVNSHQHRVLLDQLVRKAQQAQQAHKEYKAQAVHKDQKVLVHKAQLEHLAA
jgi:hypothetical protein